MINQEESSTIPAQYTHSVKIEGTAKGIRLSVHVYTNDWGFSTLALPVPPVHTKIIFILPYFSE